MVKQTIRIGDCEIVYEADTPEELAAIMKLGEAKPEPKKDEQQMYSLSPQVRIEHIVHPIVQTSHTPIRPSFAPNIQC